MTNNALFTHDHMFFESDGKIFSNGGLSSAVLSRYLKYFSSLTVLSRKKKISGCGENLSLASTPGIQFVSVPNFKSLSGISKILEARSIIDDEVKKSDYLICRVPSSISFLAISAARKYGKPYILEVVGCPWDSNRGHGAKLAKLIAPLDYFLMRFYVYSSPRNIYITESFLQARYPACDAANYVCPNVNISEVSDNVLDRRIKKIGDKKSKKVILGLIGSLDVNYKGHQTLIYAARELKQRGVDFHIEFLGKGDKTRWVEMAEKCGVNANVKFIGTLPAGEKVFSWLDSLDILVQPSAAEAQGRSIIEGMSRACPIIATAIGGIVELIESKSLIRPGDYKTLSDIVLEMSLNPEIQIMAARQNFEKSKKFYFEEIEKVRDAAFRDLISNKA